jgi:hypothetical protein
VLRAARHQHLIGGDRGRVDPRQLGGDGLAQHQQAGDVGVLGDRALAEGLDRRGLDVGRGVEVGLAGAEADDVDALGLEAGRLGGDGEGDRRLDGVEARGGLVVGGGHGGSPGVGDHFLA